MGRPFSSRNSTGRPSCSSARLRRTNTWRLRRPPTCAGRPPSSPLHDLRHAFATRLLEAGVHRKVVSEALGHASVAFTIDRYQQRHADDASAGRGRDQGGTRAPVEGQRSPLWPSCGQVGLSSDRRRPFPQLDEWAPGDSNPEPAD
ncbi:MAG: site-specific integrase [Actinomycetota bacterium]